LDNDRVVWLTTVGQDGTPQPNPVWFLYSDGDILVYNLNSANRLTHIRHRPQVSLNFNSTETGGEVVVITGTARVAGGEPLATANEAYMAKYGKDMEQLSEGKIDQFAQDYGKAIRIEIGKVRGF